MHHDPRTELEQALQHLEMAGILTDVPEVKERIVLARSQATTALFMVVKSEADALREKISTIGKPEEDE